MKDKTVTPKHHGQKGTDRSEPKPKQDRKVTGAADPEFEIKPYIHRTGHTG